MDKGAASAKAVLPQTLETRARARAEWVGVTCLLLSVWKKTERQTDRHTYIRTSMHNRRQSGSQTDRHSQTYMKTYMYAQTCVKAHKYPCVCVCARSLFLSAKLLQGFPIFEETPPSFTKLAITDPTATNDEIVEPWLQSDPLRRNGGHDRLVQQG